MRSIHPTIDQLILDAISLDYHETLNAGAGHQAEAYKHHSMEQNKGKYILVVDGSIPVKDGGIYCKVAGRTILDHLLEAAEGAAAIIHRHEIQTADDPEAKEKEKVEEYRELFYNPYVAAKQGYINAVVRPSDTRPKVIAALEALQNKKEIRPTRKHGNIPM